MAKRPLTRNENIALRMFAVVGIAVTAICGAMDLRIDVNNPQQPDPASGRVYQESVNHGHIRYVTQTEKNQLHYVGVGFACVVVTGILTGFIIGFRRRANQ
jgi:hypothetical protein